MALSCEPFLKHTNPLLLLSSRAKRNVEKKLNPGKGGKEAGGGAVAAAGPGRATTDRTGRGQLLGYVTSASMAYWGDGYGKKVVSAPGMHVPRLHDQLRHYCHDYRT